VNTVFRNVVGRTPSSTEQDLYVGMLQGTGGSFTQPQFLEIVAKLDLTAQSINLVGLQQGGVEYL
jgi:hypothetical protein